MWWLLHDHMHMSYSCKWKKFGRQYLILANSLILTSFWISWFLETFIVSSKYAFFCIRSTQSCTSEFFLLLEIHYQVKIYWRSFLWRRFIVSLQTTFLKLYRSSSCSLCQLSCCISLCALRYVHYLTVHWTQGRQDVSSEAGRRLKHP